MDGEGDSNSLVFNEEATAYFSLKDRAALLERLLAYLGLHDVEVGINIVSADEMRTLNKEYRDRDVTTDVLSFALLEELEGGMTPAGIAAEIEVLHQSGEVPVLLGDIVLSSAELGVDAADDYHVFHLVVHGLLHLLGYDHGDDEAHEAMSRKTTECLITLFGEDR